MNVMYREEIFDVADVVENLEVDEARLLEHDLDPSSLHSFERLFYNIYGD